MKTATITEAKNGLSALVEQVRAGQTVLITDRGVPVAKLEPIAGDPDQRGRLERLVRAGLVRRGAGPPPVEVIGRPGPVLDGGATLLDAVLAERRSGR